MSYSKLLFCAHHLKNGVGYRMGRRLLASETTHSSCDKPEQPLKSSDSGKKGLQKELIDRHGLVLGVWTDENGHYTLSDFGHTKDKEAGGVFTRHLNTIGPNFKLGDAFVVTAEKGEWPVVALSHYGPLNAKYNELEGLDEKLENHRWGVGAGHKALLPYNFAERQLNFESSGCEEANCEALRLAGWKFEKFRHGRYPPGYGKSIPEVSNVNRQIGYVKGDSQNWARYLADMPANKMTPMDVAEEARNVLCPLGVYVTAHDRSWIEANNMHAFLTVARGSCEAPIFLVCEYKGGGPSVLMAAKGVTFDCGGLCLKKPEDMVENRASMAGAAAALGALRGIALLKPKVNVTLVVPLCENMISGQCMKVGDVVPALNGVNIQIEDTDMEGRLMLADALVYGQIKYKPSIVIDVATLTRGITTAIGGGCYGCFTDKEYLWNCVRDAGATTGDRPWRFPLWNYYHRQIVDDPSVDLRNRGSGKATPCIGAAFLRNFVCTDWLHFDITGVGKLAHGAPPYLNSHRMSGRPTRALIQTLINIADRPKSLATESKSECKA